MPTRLIIGRDGIIRYAEINPDYTVRPDPEDTIEALKKIIDQWVPMEGQRIFLIEPLIHVFK